MEIMNAIAKVRFASARPQRIHLARHDHCVVEMLCMEPGQKPDVSTGTWTYYIVKGTAELTAGSQAHTLTFGQVASTQADELHSVANTGEGRLVCLAIGSPG
jgi:quercetin dioxygenase-like cupin family protein